MFYDHFYLMKLVQEKLLNNHGQQEILDNIVYRQHDLKHVLFYIIFLKENSILSAFVILICRNVAGPFKIQSA